MTAQLDFIRLGSWDYTSYPYTLAKIMDAWPGEWEQGKWLQYKGWRKEGLFMGHGLQKLKHKEDWGTRHTVFSASGHLAHQMQNSLAKLDGWYGTRIDVQITIPKPSKLSLFNVQAELGKDIATLYSSKDNDSVYIGARTSELFTRLYEKPLDRMYLRLEFELKSTRARSAWEAIKLGESADSIFEYYLGKSKLPYYVKNHFINADVEATTHAMNAEIAADNAKILAWIQSLDSCMMRHMNNHDIGARVIEIIRSWALHSIAVDNLHNKP